ncbi:MAG: NFACT RNA binding domain-containing protein [Candidatus Woesearchaeota archaeon]
MDVNIELSKSLEQNAEKYFNKAKKLRKKIPGINEIIKKNTLFLENLNNTTAENKIKDKIIIKKKEWYEKFRWFFSSDNYLIVGGRDSTSNEILIKKYTEKNDVVFHTELPGSPFVIIKNNDIYFHKEKNDKKKEENKIDKNIENDKKEKVNNIPKNTLIEAAEFCASYSKSWSSGRSEAEVFYVYPEQLSKNVPSGLAGLPKGSFMIYGKRNFIKVKTNIAICIFNNKVMAGPVSAISKHSKEHVEIIPGNEKLSDVAKKIQKKIGGDLDEIIRALPNNCAIKR